MKKILLTLGLITLFSISGKAQDTNSTTSTNASSSVLGDITQLFKDEASFFGTNHSVIIDVGGLYSDKQAGVLVGLHTPLPIGTNQQVSIGIVSAYLGGDFYSASLSIKGGTTFNVFGLPINLWAETGPGMNLHDQSFIEQSFAGGTIAFDITKGHDLFLSAFSGNISDRNGAVFGGSVSYTF